MVDQISLDNPREVEEWDAFVEAHPQGTPFHHSSWLRVLDETYSLKVSARICRDSDARICGIFPAVEIKNWLRGSRIVSLPFSDFCGPLFTNLPSDSDTLRGLIGMNGKNNVSFEVRSSLPENLNFARTTNFVRHILRLSSQSSDVYEKTDKRTIRYSIKKAAKNGIEVVDRTSLAGVEAYYRLHLQTRRKHGIPSQPKKLFMNLYKHMTPNGRAKILLAEHSSEPIAGGIFLILGGTIHYKFNASSPAALAASLTPNHLLTWHAMETACRDGLRFFDFGRTSLDNPGLVRYKESWGAVPVALPYSYFPQAAGVTAGADKSVTVRVLTDIWRRLPDPVAQAIGSKLYRYLT